MSRPTSVRVGTCKIDIAVHDAFYRAELKRLKQQISDCHPDRRGFTRKVLMGVGGGELTGGYILQGKTKLQDPANTRPFRWAKRRLELFIEGEVRWYATYNLSPPIIPRRGWVTEERIDRGITHQLEGTCGIE